MNLDWINGTKEQLENLKNKTGKIGFVQFNKKGKQEFDRRINAENLEIFLEDILNGEINENNAKDMFLEYIEDDHNYILKRGKLKLDSKAGKLKINIKQTKELIFGPEEELKPHEDAFEKKVEQLKNGKQGGDGLKIMTPNQLLTILPILLAHKKLVTIVKN